MPALDCTATHLQKAGRANRLTPELSGRGFFAVRLDELLDGCDAAGLNESVRPAANPKPCNRTLQTYHGQNGMAGRDMASEALMHRVSFKACAKVSLGT